jgi:hypothetical protein
MLFVIKSGEVPAMKTRACWLIRASQWVALPVALLAAPARVARVGEMEGKVEVQLHASDAWRPAVRNMPLVELALVRTPPGARVEMELDDGSALRLTGDALCEFSDYTRLSTGQLVTILSLDHGVAYFTGEPNSRDALILAMPGAQATVHTGSRVRLEARDDATQIAVLEGRVRFSSPVAEMDLTEGQTARVENATRARFFLYREIIPLDTDRWNEQRDRALASSSSTRHVPGLQYGLVDLDATGSWMQTDELGIVWKPKVASGWTPYRDGQWLWYDELGFTWIANEPWGWLPSHYGRWTEQIGLGWVWGPGKSAVFKPGEVYWLRQASVMGWGPLAPGETWDARTVPRLYLRTNTTLAKWQQDARELIPADASEKLKTAEAVFVIAPPSPALDSARLDAVRPVLRAGSTRIVPILPGVTYSGGEALPEVASAPPVPPQPAVPPMPADALSAPVPPPAYGPVPVPEPFDEYYPAPVYTGIVVVNPPEDQHHKRRDSGSPAQPAPGLGMPRGENAREARDPQPVHHVEPPQHPAGQPPAPAAPSHASQQPATPAPPPHAAEPPPSKPAEPVPSKGSDGSKSNDDSGSHSSGKHTP